MRIGIFCDSFLPDQKYALTSLDVLIKSLEERYVEVYYVTANPAGFRYESGKNYLKIPSFKIKKSSLFAFSNFLLTKKAAKTIKSWDLDIVHTYTEKAAGLLGRKAAKKYHIPHIHTFNNMYGEYLHYNVKNRVYVAFQKKCLRYYLRFFLKNCHSIITPSEKAAKILRTYGIKNSIDIIPSAIAPERYGKKIHLFEIEKLKKSYGIRASDFVAIYSGRISREKNIDMIIDAIRSLKSKSIKLLVIGEGPQKAELEEKTKEMRQIIFTGAVDKKELSSYYKMAHLFISASKAEASGIVIQEALAASLPVLCIEDESYYDDLLPGINGYFFKSKKELAQLLINLKANRKKLAEISFNTRNLPEYGEIDFVRRTIDSYFQAGRGSRDTFMDKITS